MKLWKYCAGYVNIRIVGEYPEKSLNRILASGIGIGNIRRTGEGVEARVSAADFKALRGVLRGSGNTARILDKHGVPAVKRRLRATGAFLAFLTLFAGLFLFASTRIWFIDVETVSIPKEDVFLVLNELGVVRGSRKNGSVTGRIANALAADPRIVNAKVRLEGVCLSVDISESQGAIKAPSAENGPGLYADRDCVISFISVKSGRAVVSAGTAVRAGDLLISGDLTGLKEGFFVSAEGTVLGEVLHVVTADAPRTVRRLVRTGNSVPLVSAEILGKDIVLSYPFENYELEQYGTSLLSACPIPIRIRRYRCFELEETSTEDSAEGTALRARLAAQEKLNEELSPDAEIKSVHTEIISNADGSVTAAISATTIERIGEYINGDTDD